MDYHILEESIREQAAQDSITHLAVGVAVVQDGKVLMVRRVQSDHLGGNYELPGGGVEEGESIEEAVVRETLEETGLKVKRITGTFDGFDYTTPRKPKARQINVLVEVLPGDVTLAPSEHDAFTWVYEHECEVIPMSSNMRDCVIAGLTAAKAQLA